MPAVVDPRFPIYIPSKGRADSRWTARSLEEMGVPFHIVVEKQEFAEYAKVIDKRKILVLDPEYQREYDTFDALGDSKGKGPGPARNFIWDHALSRGAEWHWVMDDNIQGFWRLNDNRKIRVSDGAVLRAMEDFCLRYENVGMAGPNYYMFASRKNRMPPFVVNTRIYSCNLIRNDIPLRWRGRYNEDTDLSLRMLKAGWCTIQFNAFLQWKMSTQLLKGGNTDEFYAQEGTFSKSQMQVAMHPDVSRLVWKFSRWHHHVDYRKWKAMGLKLKADVVVKRTPDNYGMKLRTIERKAPGMISGGCTSNQSRSRTGAPSADSTRLSSGQGSSASRGSGTTTRSAGRISRARAASSPRSTSSSPARSPRSAGTKPTG